MAATSLRKQLPRSQKMSVGSNVSELTGKVARDLYNSKNQKLCQNLNSKWRNSAMAFILNLVNITDHTVILPGWTLKN